MLHQVVEPCCPVLPLLNLFQTTYSRSIPITSDIDTTRHLYLAMEFDHIQRIWKSERLIYRSISPEDQDWMFNELESDPMNTFLSSPLLLAPPRRKKPEEWAEMWKSATSILGLVICLQPQEKEKQQQNRFHIDDPLTGEVWLSPRPAVGGAAAGAEQPPVPPTRIGILRLSYGGFGNSPHHRAGDLGVALTAAHQDRGYGTEAVRWTLDWAFRHANLHSVNLSTPAFNARAHRCYEKCGFALQGRRREVCWHDRGWHDLLFFGILEGEWEVLREKREEEEREHARELARWRAVNLKPGFDY